MSMQQAIDAIHDYWFGELDSRGMAAASQNRLWFSGGEEADTYCRRHFGTLVTQAIAGELNHWATAERGLIALVILLDQFTRNIYRGSAKAFAGDERALSLAEATIASGEHLSMPAIHRVFLYMPLEHHEDLATQNQCVALFEALEAEDPARDVAGFTRFAVAHQEVIAQFGRFPHRNVALGRESSDAEKRYLAQHGGF